MSHRLTGLLASISVCATASGLGLQAQSLGGWEAPDGGWDYVYAANDGEDVDGQIAGGGSLDGTWTHQNGSDEWDGSGPGDEFASDGVKPHSPGGAGTEILPGAGEGGSDAEVLTVVDTGDPRNRGFADPSNRKLWFCHDVAQDSVDGSSALGNGLTLIVRSRLHPDADPDTAGWQTPDGGLDNDAGQGVAPGYTLRDGGKGGHGYYDALLDRNFSFTPYGTSKYQLPPVVAEGTTPPNLLDVGDTTVFHAFWVVIEAGDQADRFNVTVYLDGATAPSQVFTNIQLGDDTDCDGMSHLHMGFHSTPQIGAFQVDYFGYKIGAFEPSSPCPGGFAAELDGASGNVNLSWSPVGSVDSYTVRRDGAPIAEGLARTASSYTDTSPARPSATYELVPIVGGAPKAGCSIASVTVHTVVCPVLTAVPDKAAGKVNLSWTAPQHFAPTGYNILRDGVQVGSAGAGATSHSDAAPPGEHNYELEVLGPGTPCPTNPFAAARLLAPGAVDVSGDAWDQVVIGGVATLATTSDSVKSLYFPAGPKTAADAASFAVQVSALGPGELPNGRFRVEVQARFDNPVRITNRSAIPPSYVQLDLSRTGVSVATDDLANQEPVEQVPSPEANPALPSSSSTIVNTDTIGIELVEGLNLIEIAPVDAGGAPHADNVQLFATRIGPFAPGLVASLAPYPCPAGLTCAREPNGDMRLAWSAGQPHAYEIERDGAVIATIPMGATTSHVDANPGRGFFSYTLRATDDALCPELTCVGGGGIPDADGFIREWLIFGPLDWGCAAACDAPGEALMRGDYLQGTLVGNGSAIGESDVEPVVDQEIALTPPVTVRAAPRAELNPNRPGTGRWFSYASSQSLIDYNVVFGADPGNNFMVYAVTYVDNTTGDDLTVDLGITSDDAVQVFIGDEEVHINNVARGVGLPGSGAFDVVPGVTLPAGLSRLMVKVFEGGGDTGFALRFEEPGTGTGIVDGIEVNLTPATEPPRPVFHRGDSNNDGKHNISDPVNTLNVLFLGSGAIPCQDAADSNDDGQVNISDPVNSLNVLFLGVGAVPPPLPPEALQPCGVDPTEDRPSDLGCETYAHC